MPFITSNFTVLNGEVITGEEEFYIQESDATADFVFLNLGEIRTTRAGGAIGILANGSPANNFVPTFDNRGLLEVTSTTMHTAWAVLIANFSQLELLNTGTIRAIGPQHAYGVDASIDFDLANDGTIEATSTGRFNAHAVYMYNGGSVTNTGSIISHGNFSSIAVWTRLESSVLTNSGFIEALAGGSIFARDTIGVRINTSPFSLTKAFPTLSTPARSAATGRSSPMRPWNRRETPRNGFITRAISTGTSACCWAPIRSTIRRHRRKHLHGGRQRFHRQLYGRTHQWRRRHGG